VSEDLNEIAARQHVWKSHTMQKIAARICRVALQACEFWPDQIDTTDIPDTDKNCIGIVWRTLRRLKIIEQTGLFRPSEAASTRGRIVFQYTAPRPSLARALLERIDANLIPEPQGVLSL
jgi:hypothetical protein